MGSYSQSQNGKDSTIVLVDSVFTPKKYLPVYIKGDYWHAVYGINAALNGKVIGINKQGKKLFKLNLIDGIFDGEQKYFYASGQIYLTGFFDKGTLTGTHISYFPNGKIAGKSIYKNGIENGTFETWWENGQKNTEDFFIDGVLQYSKVWNEKGQLQSENNYSVKNNNGNNCLENMAENLTDYNVNEFKDSLLLTLTIDSILFSYESQKVKLIYKLTIAHESPLLKLNDSISIKIFIARNYEYGKKFYTMKWDYFKNNGSCDKFIQSSNYDKIKFGTIDKNNSGDYGQGIGAMGEDIYTMIYYRYKLE
jgi:hypothetical protein